MSDSTDLPQASASTSEADADGASGVAPEEPTLGGIPDDQLPEDLQPSEDNPLAQPLDPDDESTKSREELGVLDEAETSEDADSSGTGSA